MMYVHKYQFKAMHFEWSPAGFTGMIPVEDMMLYYICA